MGTLPRKIKPANQFNKTAYPLQEAKLPFDYVITVSKTNPDAHFVKVQDAIDYQQTQGLLNCLILIDTGVYVENLTFTTVGYVTLRGMTGVNDVTLKGIGSASIVINTPYVRLENLTVQDGTSICIQIQSNHDGCEFIGLKINAINAAASPTTAVGIYVAGGTTVGTLIKDCDIVVNSATVQNAGVYSDVNSVIVRVVGGRIQASGATDNWDITPFQSGSVINLRGVHLRGGGIQVSGASGTPTGYYVDSNGDVAFAGSSVVSGIDKAKVSKLRESDDGGDALTVDATGNVSLLKGLILSEATLTLGNGNNNDVSISDVIVLTISGPTAAFTITGMTGGTQGRLIIILNNTGQNMTLANSSGSSSAANQITTTTGANMTSTGNVAAALIYRNARWRVLLFQD